MTSKLSLDSLRVRKVSVAMWPKQLLDVPKEFSCMRPILDILDGSRLYETYRAAGGRRGMPGPSEDSSLQEGEGCPAQASAQSAGPGQERSVFRSW